MYEENLSTECEECVWGWMGGMKRRIQSYRSFRSNSSSRRNQCIAQHFSSSPNSTLPLFEFVLFHVLIEFNKTANFVRCFNNPVPRHCIGFDERFNSPKQPINSDLKIRGHILPLRLVVEAQRPS